MTQRITQPVLNFYRFYNVDLAREIKAEILAKTLDWIKVGEGLADHCDLEPTTLASMARLRAWLQTCLDQVTEQDLPPGMTCTPTELWLTRTQEGEHMHQHSHPMSVYSGVFYLQDSSGSTEFTLPSWLSERWPQMVYPRSVGDHATWSSPCREGHMIIFPSHVFHRQRPLSEPGPRYSLAWNSFWQGTLSDQRSLRLRVQSGPGTDK